MAAQWLPKAVAGSRQQLSMAGRGGAPDGGNTGAGALNGINQGLISTLIKGEGAVLAAAAALSALGGINPLSGFVLDSNALTIAAVAALPIFLISVALERSNIKLFKEIDRDTQLFVIQLFGVKRNIGAVLAPSLAMAAAAGIAEELLFRGVLQQGLTQYIGDLPSLLVCSLLFGLAHNPVPGASSLVESVYGLTFGAVYLFTGGNIGAAILSHWLYDFATFLEVHLRATGNMGVATQGGFAAASASQSDSPTGDKKLDSQVRGLISQYRLSTNFVKVAYGVFKRLDLDGNGSIDKNELRLGVRTFGKFTDDNEIDSIFKRADTNKDNEIQFDEYLKLLVDNALMAQKQARDKQIAGRK